MGEIDWNKINLEALQDFKNKESGYDPRKREIVDWMLALQHPINTGWAAYQTSDPENTLNKGGNWRPLPQQQALDYSKVFKK